MELSRREVIERIKIEEKNHNFYEHIDPIDFSNYYEIDENYPYIKKPLKLKIYNFFTNIFIVRPFTNKVNRDLQVEIKGKENLIGLNGAIVTCNHINKLDCLVAKKSINYRKTFITAAFFNNQKGAFGNYMRVGGMIPMPKSHSFFKYFDECISYHLNKGHFVVFYPEQAMWWNYEKPRPYKNGAFHYAVNNNKPVLPTFITMINLDELDEEGLNKKKYIYNILKPVYPKSELTPKENIEYLKNEAFREGKECYERFYQTKLEYGVDND